MASVMLWAGLAMAQSPAPIAAGTARKAAASLVPRPAGIGRPSGKAPIFPAAPAHRPVAMHQYKLDSLLTFSMNSPTDSVLAYKETYTYNAEGDLTTGFFWSWDDQSVSVYREQYQYDALGRLAEFTAHTQVGTMWEGNNRSTYEWGENDQLLTSITYRPGLSGDTWREMFQYVYTYNPQQQLQELVINSREGQAWTKYSRTTYAYDAAGQLVETIDYVQTDQNEEIEWFRTTDQYDAHGNLLEQIVYFYDGTGWSIDSRQTFEYDAADQLIAYIYYQQDGDALVENNRETYVYQGDGTLRAYTDYEWVEGDWIEEGKEEYGYQPAESASRPWLPPAYYETLETPLSFYSDTQWLRASVAYSINEGAWQKESATTRYYSPQTVTQAAQWSSSAAVTVYPNPAAGSFTLDLRAVAMPPSGTYAVQLCTTTGQVVRTWAQHAPKATLALGSLPAGVYFVTLTLPQGVVHKRLVIK
ncbi:Por secretion system C-terminal sorting domain-containing protein [Catalinimonas alkaloidigena]|uniref:Por secretion system C-terminal sorting domain-containing protein n=2 Tax=Catalinimonas alkaloidigena TaxID=1075417 RepID=A0A1G9D5Q4_9BACT|nr:Por secretion system C-terminal sorting domain-containing protein [Catalinimonas alkaloidigena]